MERDNKRTFLLGRSKPNPDVEKLARHAREIVKLATPRLRFVAYDVVTGRKVGEYIR